MNNDIDCFQLMEVMETGASGQTVTLHAEEGCSKDIVLVPTPYQFMAVKTVFPGTLVHHW